MIVDGNSIKVERIKKQIKAIEFSKRLGISPSKLSLIENGHIEPDNMLLKDINRLLAEK